MTGTKIMVTGGAGFIGSHLARRLLNTGNEVVVVDNLSTGFRQNVPDAAEFVEGDLREPDFVAGLPRDCAAVLHLAAQSSGEVSAYEPVVDLDTNVRGTLLLLEHCRRNGIPRFLYAGSMAAYGDQDRERVDEGTPLWPLSNYGITKKCAEDYLRRYGKQGIGVTVLRLFSVYGPGQNRNNMRQGMVSIFLEYLLRGEPVTVKGSFRRFRDFVYIDDVVDAWLRALASPASCGRTYNIGSGVRITVADLVAALIEAYGEPADYPVVQSDPTPDDQLGLCADIARARNELQWRPRTSLREGLRRMIESVRADGSGG